MLPVMSSSSWFPTMFDEFFNNDWMPKMQATAPAINVKENSNEYTMEFAVPGIKKEFCRVNLNNDGNLEVTIENKLEHKEDNKKEHYLRREFSYSNYQQVYVLPDDVKKENIGLYRFCPWIAHTNLLAKYHRATVQEERQVTHTPKFGPEAFHL